MKNEKTKILVECALLIAIGTVLSFVKIWQMPLGGAVTLLSMLPVCIISIRHGLSWGLGSAFVYSVLQLAFGLSNLLSWGISPAVLAGSLIFDYIIPFTGLGLAGVFRKKGRYGICLGVVMVMFIRFIAHVISGIVLFAEWCPEGWNVVSYSICYNGAVMLPEMILTAAGILILSAIPTFYSKVLK